MTPDAENLVLVRFDEQGLPKSADLFRGTIGPNIGPDNSRTVAQGYTSDGQFIMHWADTGEILVVGDTELPTEVGSIKPVRRTFGEQQFDFQVARTPRGHRIASIQKVTPTLAE